MSQSIEILMVEDSASDAELLVNNLRRANFDPHWHRVETESDYLVGLRPDLDLIISDFTMPQFDGLRALDLLKKQGYDIPFIIVSGTMGEERAVEAIKQGAADYLMKDRTERLGSAVSHALEECRLRQVYRKAEQALQEGERKFRTLFDAAHDAIYMLHDGVFVECNANGQYMYGRTWEQIVGHTPDEFAPPNQPDGRNSREKAYEIVQKALAGEAQFFEWMSIHYNGTPVLSEVSLNRVKMDGKVYLMAVMRDITERKRAEENNVRSLALLRGTLDSTADGILTIGLDRQILSFNETFAKMWGIPADILANNNDDLAIQFVLDQLQMPEDFLAKVHHLYNHPLEESVDVVDFKDGRVFERFSRPMLVEGHPIGRVWSFRDVTERKRAEKQIAEQAAFLDKARDAIIVRDLEGKILYWNKGAERVYGWTREEIVGRNAVEFLHTDPKKFEELNRLTISQGEWKGELRHFTSDGREITVEVHTTLIRDNEGHPKSVLSINTDITERKKIEAQFMRAQRMESIGKLAGGVAHDLNNILAPIMMSIEILQTKVDDPQAKQVLETIEVSAKRGADIVRQVLSFARGLKGERIEIQPKHLLKELGNIIKDTFPKDIQLQFSIPKDIWTILGDPTQMHQVLLNLCVNARDAMPNGGHLAINVENCLVDKQYALINPQAKPGRYVKISITDSGTGIPPELLDTIFDPFFTTKPLGEGTGLGLSTVMAIVKSHDGLIDVNSEPGKGTTFIVCLPAMKIPPEALRKQTQLVSAPRGNGETVLVVDDEASILAITSHTLRAFGYQVLTAMNGTEAVAVYSKHKNEIAVVITDMMMPVMNGMTMIDALMQINPAIKVIAMSGLTATGVMAKVLESGVKHCLAKPYTARTLLKTMRTALDEA